MDVTILIKILCGIGLDILAKTSNISSAIKVSDKFDKNLLIAGIKKYVIEIITVMLFAVVATQLPIWLDWCGVDLTLFIKNNFGVDVSIESISSTAIVLIYAYSIITYLIKTLDNIKKSKDITK